MFKLYEYAPSGNFYKVRLLLTQLNLAIDRTPINILQKESRIPEFLVKNPNGQIPVLKYSLSQKDQVRFGHRASGIGHRPQWAYLTTLENRYTI